jgi:hypothetical protein
MGRAEEMVGSWETLKALSSSMTISRYQNAKMK